MFTLELDMQRWHAVIPSPSDVTASLAPPARMGSHVGKRSDPLSGRVYSR